jgi:hypothetical protein
MEKTMKKVIAIMFAFFTIFALTAFAADQSVHFSTATNVAGTKVPAGDYILRYEIKGKAADVTVLQGTKAVANTKAEIVERTDPSPYNSIVRSENADGTSSLKEIQMANKKQVIRLQTEETAVGK